MNESGLSHLATISTTTTTASLEHFEDSGCKEKIEEINIRHPPPPTPTVRKRARKINPKFSTEEEEAAEALLNKQAWDDQFSQIHRDRQSIAANVFIPTGESYKSLTDLTNPSTTAIKFSSVANFPLDQDQGEFGFGLTGPCTVSYFHRDYKPEINIEHREDVDYKQSTLVLIHELLPFKTRNLHIDKRRFFTFPSAPDFVYDAPNRRIRLKTPLNPADTISVIVESYGVFDELFGLQKKSYLDHDDKHNITVGLETYLKYKDTSKSPVQQVYDCQFIDSRDLVQTVDVQEEPKPEEEVVDIVIDSQSAESNQFLRLNYDHCQPDPELYVTGSQTQPIFSNSRVQEVLPCPRPTPFFHHQQQYQINSDRYIELTSPSNRARKTYPQTPINFFSDAVTPLPSQNNLATSGKRKTKVVDPNPPKPKRKYTRRVYSSESQQTNTSDINGVNPSAALAGKLGNTNSKPKRQKGQRVKDPNMENRLKMKTKEGFVIRCKCGTCSSNLHSCTSCLKKFPRRAKLVPYPSTTPPISINRKQTRYTEIEDSIVTLSSDEEVSSEDMKQKQITYSASKTINTASTPSPVSPSKRQAEKVLPSHSHSIVTLAAVPSTLSTVIATGPKTISTQPACTVPITPLPPPRVVMATALPTRVRSPTPPPTRMAIATPPPTRMAIATPPPTRMAIATPPPTRMATATPPPTRVIIVTPPPSNVAVPLQEPSTVSLLVASSSPIAPPPPSTVVTAFVPKLQPNTPVNVEQLTPFQNVVTTQSRVSMPKIMSDELVPEDMNPAQLPLPVVLTRPSVRINMGNPNPTPPTPAPNVLNHINIVHRSNGNVAYSRKNGTSLNQQKQMSSQGTRKNLPSPPTNDVDNSTSPEDVILQIEGLTADGGPKRADGAVSHFTTTEFRSLRIGSYKPNLPKNNTRNLVTFSDFGILFNTPHAKSEAIVKCGIPADQIMSIHAHFPNRLPLLAITTTLRYASWLRERLGMNNSPSMPNFYCPSKGGPSEKYLLLIFGDNFQAMDVGVIKRIYKRDIIDIDFSKANSLLVDSVEEKTHSQLISTPVVVVPRPPPPTPVRPALSTPISVVQTPNTRNSVKTEAVKEAKLLLTMKLGNKQLATSILTTDILCLAEEQFLNDQMIDFWLEYVISGLSETNRARTHVFSNYFYKCLTTRPKRRSCAPWETDSNITASERRHCRVKKWTKNVDIFSKDFIIIPINEKGGFFKFNGNANRLTLHMHYFFDSAHWFLAIICFPGITGICSMEDGTPLPNVKNTKERKKKKPEDMEEEPRVDPDRDEEVGCPEGEMQFETDEDGLTESESDDCRKEGSIPNLEFIPKTNVRESKPRVKQPCIVTFDSMPNESRDRVYSTLREYIRVEHKVRKGVERTFTRNEMPGYRAVVPDQPNHYDCGIYLLQYVESFFSKPLKSFLLPLPHLTHWFEDSIVYTKRKEIYEKMCDLIKTEHPENVPYIPALKFNPPPSSPKPSVSEEQEPQPGSSKSVIKNTTKRPHTGDDSGPKTKTPCHSN